MGMTLESQVVSLPLAKRLKELGVKQESLVYWCVAENGQKWLGYSVDHHTAFGEVQSFSSFTVGELGEMLPRGIYSYKNDCKGSRWRALGEADMWDRSGGVVLDGRPFQDAESEADARAKMLVYLLEKGMVKP